MWSLFIKNAQGGVPEKGWRTSMAPVVSLSYPSPEKVGEPRLPMRVWGPPIWSVTSIVMTFPMIHMKWCEMMSLEMVPDHLFCGSDYFADHVIFKTRKSKKWPPYIECTPPLTLFYVFFWHFFIFSKALGMQQDWGSENTYFLTNRQCDHFFMKCCHFFVKWYHFFINHDHFLMTMSSFEVTPN